MSEVTYGMYTYLCAWMSNKCARPPTYVFANSTKHCEHTNDHLRGVGTLRAVTLPRHSLDPFLDSDCFCALNAINMLPETGPQSCVTLNGR